MAVNTTFVDGTTTILSTWLNWANQVINGIAGIGYLLTGAGVGGSVTQLVTKANPVTLNTYCGRITTPADSLAGGATTSFLVNNNKIATNDVVLVSMGNTSATGGAYNLWAEYSFGFGFKVYIKNNTAGALLEALVINFTIIKGTIT